MDENLSDPIVDGVSLITSHIDNLFRDEKNNDIAIFMGGNYDPAWNNMNVLEWLVLLKFFLKKSQKEDLFKVELA